MAAARFNLAAVRRYQAKNREKINSARGLKLRFAEFLGSPVSVELSLLGYPASRPFVSPNWGAAIQERGAKGELASRSGSHYVWFNVIIIFVNNY